MDILIFAFEIIGTVAFSVSGAMTGLKKNMDIFGVMIAGSLLRRSAAESRAISFSA